MQPNSLFATELGKFIDGTPRASLHESVRRQIAAFRFVSCAESTIEGKHAKVALANRSHFVGPERVSLSNRLPMLERWLRAGHATSHELLE